MTKICTMGPLSESIRVEIVGDDSSACDEFVRNRPESRLCHLTQWSTMIARTFGHRAFYLAALEDNDVTGVLPLTLVKSRLFGTRMVSQAFSNYGGALATDLETLRRLVHRAVELASQHRCEQLELRNLSPVPEDLPAHTDKVCMHLSLTGDPDDQWSQFRPEIRNRVRKAQKLGLHAVFGGREMLREFYRVWTMRMQQLGTPAYSHRLFESILETFPGWATIGLVKLGNRTVGAGFFYVFNGLAQCRWASVDVSFNRQAPNVLLYWFAIRHYCQRGASAFDFGRSTLGSTQYEFKRRWGAKVVQLHYQYWTPPGAPLRLVKPDDPKYRRKTELWKRLPLWTTRLIGPVISRSLV